jgi:hypothetical protein
MAKEYGQWAEKIHADVLAGLTSDQLYRRLRKVQAHWEKAAGQGGTDVLAKALIEAGEILTAPAPTPAGTAPSVLKTIGITGADMDQHGRWISRIPDETLSKMDRPSVV